MPLSALAQRLDGDGTVEGFVLGAALDVAGALEGVAGCVRQTAVKERHKAMVWGMYVAPEMRGRGVGGRLLDALIARAATWEGLEQLTLTVVPVNERARCLCLRRGFVSYGVAPRALKHGASTTIWSTCGCRCGRSSRAEPQIAQGAQMT
jgi:GNAT superfamily N-acetyltransferase